MIKITFTEEDKRLLAYERYHHPHPFVQKKMQVLWLKSQEIPHGKILELESICEKTLVGYLREYQEGGINALKTINFYKPQSAMTAHQETLEAHFRLHPPASTKEAMDVIEKMTGIKRSPERVRVFLKKMGMKCRKVGVIPAKADIKKQEDFKKKNWNLGLKKPKKASEPSFLLMPLTLF